VSCVNSNKSLTRQRLEYGEARGQQDPIRFVAQEKRDRSPSQRANAGRILSSRARRAKQTTLDGPLQRLLVGTDNPQPRLDVQIRCGDESLQ
jgi:hypothetical protein